MSITTRETSMSELEKLLKQYDEQSLDEQIKYSFGIYNTAKSIGEKAEQAIEVLMCLSVRDKNEQEFEDLYDFATFYGKIITTIKKRDLNPALSALFGKLSPLLDEVTENISINLPSKEKTLDKTEEEIAEFEKAVLPYFEKFEQAIADYEKSNDKGL